MVKITNKKAQDSMPINYIIIMVIALLVVVMVLYAAVRFEIFGKAKDLPIGDEEVEIDEEIVESQGLCDIKIGYFARTTKEGYKTDLKYLHYMDGKVLPVYKENRKLWMHANLGSWLYGIFDGDTELGIMQILGNDHIRFFCDAYQASLDEDSDSTLTQKYFDYFNGGYVISGFMLEGKEIICKQNRSYSMFECLEGTSILDAMNQIFNNSYLISMSRGSGQLLRLKCGEETDINKIKPKLNELFTKNTKYTQLFPGQACFYECRLTTINVWFACKPELWRFCSEATSALCFEYAWNDDFEFYNKDKTTTKKKLTTKGFV